MVGKPQTKKGKPRGRPWPKGVSGHPAGNRHLGDVLRSRFAHEMLKVVPAKVGGVMIEAPRYELFITQMIEAGIKGNTPARKLLLEFMNANDAAEVAAEAAGQAGDRGRHRGVRLGRGQRADDQAACGGHQTGAAR